MARLCKHKTKRCKSPNCRRDTKGRQFCATCRSRKTRAKDPIRHAYNNLKASATRRDIEFTITLDYFRKFCYCYKFIKNMGRTAHSYSIDRKKNHLGYIPGNIQVLTISQNASKGTKVLSYDWNRRDAKWF